MSYPTAPKRAVSTRNKLALSVLAVIAVCIGGAATISSFTDDGPKPAAATTDASQAARFVLPTATYPPAVTPQPVATPAKKATRPTTARAQTTVPKPTTRRPATKKPKPSPTTSTPRAGVHPGAFCSEHDELGRTVTGKLMRCETTAKDSRYRWRAA